MFIECMKRWWSFNIQKVTIHELVFYLNRILPWKAMRGRSHAIDDPVARILIWTLTLLLRICCICNLETLKIFSPLLLVQEFILQYLVCKCWYICNNCFNISKWCDNFIAMSGVRTYITILDARTYIAITAIHSYIENLWELENCNTHNTWCENCIMHNTWCENLYCNTQCASRYCNTLHKNWCCNTRNTKCESWYCNT